jgi:hypothetical protein
MYSEFSQFKKDITVKVDTLSNVVMKIENVHVSLESIICKYIPRAIILSGSGDIFLSNICEI